MNVVVKNLAYLACAACFLAPALQAQVTPAMAASQTAPKKRLKKAKAKKVYSSSTYLKQKAAQAAAHDASAPGRDTTAALPERSVIGTVECLPELPPTPCEPGSASCDRVEIAPKTVAEGGAVGNVPQGDDLAKALFKKVRERCRSEGRAENKTFEPVVGLSIAPPTGADDSTKSESMRVLNMGRRVGATVGFKAKF